MIKLTNLERIYQKPNQAPVRALNKLSLNIEKGEFIAILGPSGSGKSTLMNVMGLLDQPDKGSYWFNGQDVSSLSGSHLAAIRNKNIGFVFQSFHLLAKTTALENVQLPLLYSKDKNFSGKAEQALSAVGLIDRSQHFTHELSGGQQQRVAIARAIVNEPDIIFADEPTGNLDSESESEILKLFQSINASGRTVVFITHNLEVAKIAKRVIRIRDGVIESDQENTAAMLVN